MLRNIGAVLLGLVVGMAFNMAIVMLNAYVLFPMPTGTDMNDPMKFSAYIATLPTSAFLMVMLAHLGQAFFGGWAAARVGGSRPMLLAMVVGVLSLIGGILNMMSVRGPTWMVVELPLYLVLAAVAGQIEVRRRERRS